MWVADGVRKVDGGRIANVYLAVMENGLLLVDTGMPGNAKRILRFVEGIGASRTSCATSSSRTATSITSAARPS